MDKEGEKTTPKHTYANVKYSQLGVAKKSSNKTFPYNEAWNHPDEKFRERWRIAIRKELRA